MRINKKKMVMKSFLLIGIVTIVLCSLISAFGYSSVYDAVTPLKVAPGGTEEIVVKIKSSAVEGDLVVKAELINDAGIAKITDFGDEYDVSPGLENDGLVNLKISVPQEAVVGQEYDIELKLSDMTPIEVEGTVALTSGIFVNIPVIVEGEPVKDTNTIWYWVIAIVIVIAIIWFVKKKKTSIPASTPTKK